MKILIKGGRLIDPASGLDRIGDLCVAAGRIVALGDVSADFQPDRVIDEQGGGEQNEDKHHWVNLGDQRRGTHHRMRRIHPRPPPPNRGD